MGKVFVVGLPLRRKSSAKRPQARLARHPAFKARAAGAGCRICDKPGTAEGRLQCRLHERPAGPNRPCRPVRVYIRSIENRMRDVCHPYTDSEAADQVVANTRRWLERAVIGLNLCPFAKSVFVKKQVRYALTAASTADELLAELESELALLAETDPAALDTTLLIHPQAMTDFLDYHFFLGEVDALIRRLDYEGVFQVASLHPQYEFAGSEPDEIANYTNRSPYPTLHLLRESSIDRAVAAFPEAESIFERNIDTMARLGHEGWKKLWLG